MYNGVHNINERLLVQHNKKILIIDEETLKKYNEFMECHFDTEEDRFAFEWSAAANRCDDNNWGDPTNYNRGGEIIIANILGFTIAPTKSGADGFDTEDRGVEFKSTIQPKLQATYNGISNKDTWPEQEKYLREEKIGKYHMHYLARVEKGFPVELWVMPATKVLDILIPKVKRQFYGLQEKLENGKIPADPRFGVSLTEKEIKKYGVKLI